MPGECLIAPGAERVLKRGVRVVREEHERDVFEFAGDQYESEEERKKRLSSRGLRMVSVNEIVILVRGKDGNYITRTSKKSGQERR